MAELCRRPLAYRAIILSLASLYREELALIAAVKRRWPHIDVWLTQTDGRHAALADAMRLGADGLLGEDGLHRTAVAGPGMELSYPAARAGEEPALPPPSEEREMHDTIEVGNEPILTADELRALLSEQPVMPPGGEGDA